MSTLNISIPESMKAYVEEQAAAGEFTTSEYVRHLIRRDQDEHKREKRAQIAQYLALCEQQFANGEYEAFDMEKIIKEGEKLYKARSKRNGA